MNKNQLKCPNCNSYAVQVAVCYDYNPVFNCQLDKNNYRHRHIYCGNINCKYEWIDFIDNPLKDKSNESKRFNSSSI